jgi:ABC-type oligopeptide transport system substrate-binding subunit
MKLFHGLLGCLILALFAGITTPGFAQVPASESVRVQAPLPSNLDPVGLARLDKAGRDIAENLFVGLVRYNPVTGMFDKALAKSWEVSPDGLTWTFQLRTDIPWVRRSATTGQIEVVRPVNPGDFVYAIRRACDQAAPNPEAPSIFIIAGCTTINNANPIQVTDVFIARNLKVIASGGDKLAITFAFPISYTEALLALPEFRPVPREAASPDTSGWAARAATIVTNGPYVVSSWGPEQITLTRNPFWPSDGGGTPGNVAEVIYGNVPASFDVSRSSGSPASGITDSVVVLGFSTERPGVSVDGFRRALAASIDRQALVSMTGSPLLSPASALVAGADRPNGGFDSVAAKAALAATPYAGCNRLPDKFDIGIDDRPESAVVAQFLVTTWNKMLGCNPTSFNIRKFDPAKLLRIASGAANVDENQQGAPRPHMWIVRWSPDYHDMNAWTGDLLHCRYGFLKTGIPCGDVDALVDATSREPDPAKRVAAYAQAESLWFDANGVFPVIPLYRVAANVQVQPWISHVLSSDGTDAAFRFDLWQIDAAKRGS